MNPEDESNPNPDPNSNPEDEEFPEFTDVISILRRGRSDVDDEQPSEALWQRIQAGLELGDGPVRSASEGSASVVDVPEDDVPDDVPEQATVTSLTDARSKRSVSHLTAALIGIAAAILLVALPLGLAYRSSQGSDSTAELDAIAELQAMGDAAIDGRVLTVDTEGLTPTVDSSYELWLLDLEDGVLNDLVWVGVIEADGTFEIPEGVDLDTFNVVDISIEPHDGNPEHSGASVLRGELA